MAVGLKASSHFQPGGGGRSDRSDDELATLSLGATVAVTTMLSVVTPARRGVAGLTSGTLPTVMTTVADGEGRELVVGARLPPDGKLAPREEPSS
ncbi:hypothetical protein E2562_023072 [Oryza meyeriana var. granulata]|uniref:Uncharacterized protein n=1 Tax=Oryza meyeriana var. granulata TaxID=110450 RepID=A0A6G1EP08_9ORYZ|nr:hypothetical protein E2562_023072 [Oryza meyeriana var. granulata]